MCERECTSTCAVGGIARPGRLVPPSARGALFGSFARRVRILQSGCALHMYALQCTGVKGGRGERECKSGRRREIKSKPKEVGLARLDSLQASQRKAHVSACQTRLGRSRERRSILEPSSHSPRTEKGVRVYGCRSLKSNQLSYHCEGEYEQRPN